MLKMYYVLTFTAKLTNTSEVKTVLQVILADLPQAELMQQ